ncbi:hypothetical protein ES703_66682 [subsurface metagenome]
MTVPRLQEEWLAYDISKQGEITMTFKGILGNFLQHDQNMPKSVWGKQWTRDRKWVIPAWFIYEASMRFYDYAFAVHNYIEKRHVPYIGEVGMRTLGALSSGVVFLVCSAFLVIPGCFALYIFFKKETLTGTKLEERIKRFL